jgi:hypothetical protein
MGIKKSNEIIGRVLAKCISHGLRGTSISPSDVGMDMGNRDDLLHFADVMKWLKNERLLTTGYETLGGDYFGVQLTSRGIATVESEKFSNEGRSVREVVGDAPTGGLGGDVYGKIGSFVGGLVGGLSQSIR